MEFVMQKNLNSDNRAFQRTDENNQCNLKDIKSCDFVRFESLFVLKSKLIIHWKLNAASMFSLDSLARTFSQVALKFSGIGDGALVIKKRTELAILIFCCVPSATYLSWKASP